MPKSVRGVSIPLGMSLKKWNKDISSAQRSFKRFGRKMKGIGDSLSRNVSLPLLSAGAAAFKFAIDFNKSMADVATLLPGQTERVKELKKSVQDLAIETGKSTQDLSAGLYDIVSAFGDSADTAEILDISARSATAGMATTKDAIELTSAVTKNYGDTSAEAVQKVSDLAFQAVKLGQTTFPELAQSIGEVTPLVRDLGGSQEELFGVYATLTGVTGNASKVTTQLRGAMQALMSPTASTKELLQQLGHNSGRALIQSKGLFGAIKTLTTAAQDSGKPLQNFIGSIEGQTLALALTGAQADNYRNKLQQMGVSAGSMNEAFSEATTGVNKAGFTFSQLQQKLVVTAQEIGDKLAPALNRLMNALDPLIDKVVKSIDAFSKMDSKVQGAIIATVGLATAIGPLLSIFGRLVPLLSGTLGVLGKLPMIVTAVGGQFMLMGKSVRIGFKAFAAGKGIMKSLAIAFSPVLLKIAAIGAALAGLAIAVTYVYENWEAFKERLTDINWWRNMLISMVQFLIENSPIGLMIKGLNSALEYFGQTTIPNPFASMAGELEELKGKTEDYENEFGSFTGAMTSMKGRLVGVYEDLKNKVGGALGFMGEQTRAVTDSANSTAKGGGGSKKSGSKKSGIKKINAPSVFQGETGPNLNPQKIDTVKTKLKDFGKVAVEVNQLVQRSMADMATGIGENIGKLIAGVGNMTSFLDGLLVMMADFVKQFGQLMIAQATAAIALQTLFANPFVALAAGIALVAAGTAIKALMSDGPGGGKPAPALAEGGLAYGPTMAMVGDNKNAGSDPEVISPLSKLKNYMGGGQTITNVINLDGKTIYHNQKQVGKRYK